MTNTVSGGHYGQSSRQYRVQLSTILLMYERLVSPQAFLNWLFQQKQIKNPKYSLRAWAPRLGISVSTLSRILSGQRRVTYDLAVKIAQNLDTCSTEKFLFLLVVLKCNSTLDFEQSFYQKFLTEIANSLANPPPPEIGILKE